MTENTMVKREETKEQKMIYKTIHGKEYFGIDRT
jgi:hypothetical protein